jgi:hypothetical protein
MHAGTARGQAQKHAQAPNKKSRRKHAGGSLLPLRAAARLERCAGPMARRGLTPQVCRPTAGRIHPGGRGQGEACVLVHAGAGARTAARRAGGGGVNHLFSFRFCSVSSRRRPTALQWRPAPIRHAAPTHAASRPAISTRDRAPHRGCRGSCATPWPRPACPVRAARTASVSTARAVPHGPPRPRSNELRSQSASGGRGGCYLLLLQTLHPKRLVPGGLFLGLLLRLSQVTLELGRLLLLFRRGLGPTVFISLCIRIPDAGHG